jgi:AraC-like DNA-binding protein
MKVKSYKPQNPLLQQYIECFYTIRRRPEDANETYIAFPNIFSMICLNADSQTRLVGRNIITTHSHCPHNKLESALICNFTTADWVRYEGAADEMVIYFKPLGINAFLERDLKHYLPSFFVKFHPFDDYRTAMLEIFSIEDGAARIQALENYWLSKYRGFEHPFLHCVVSEMMNEGGSSSISKAARRNGISRPTLNKHFDRHICTTPSQFKKIVRFRNAMKHHRQKIAAENLADISTGADYFDQSHMIKDFRTLTNHSPKTFFSKISTLEDGQINWLFL